MEPLVGALLALSLSSGVVAAQAMSKKGENSPGPRGCAGGEAWGGEEAFSSMSLSSLGRS